VNNTPQWGTRTMSNDEGFKIWIMVLGVWGIGIMLWWLLSVRYLYHKGALPPYDEPADEPASEQEALERKIGIRW